MLTRMFSARTRLSVIQFLLLQDGWSLGILLEKYGILVQQIGAGIELNGFKESIATATPDQFLGLLNEVVRTRGDLRNHVAPRYRFDERWEDLGLCLRLDGYVVNANALIPIDPAIEALAGLEDDLTNELLRSGLEEAIEITRTMENSAEAFRRNPPDYNACLGNARVALQTLATAIARVRQPVHGGNFDETSWGQVLAHLRVSGLITVEEEAGLAGVFRFVSPGAHRPVGLDEQEVARLGRSLVASMCYFLIKQQMANP
jgi:hypothetical protein